MRKTYNSVAEVRITDSLETARRLHRSVTEIVKKLDEQKNHVLSISDIFVPSAEVLRAKLKDYCERLILRDPIGNVRKMEELLWRKAFYDIVYTAKKLRKSNTWNDMEKALLSVHLAVGVGYYHHLILRLQSEYNLDLLGVIDFAFTHNESISSYAKTKTGQYKAHTNEVKQCVMRLIHRSLVCLGDLSRYKLEIESNWDPMIAKRYYKMAISIDPNIGIPHNQLGTIAGSKNYGLDAVYHYMRCVLCTEPFEGAEGNLKRSMITNSICTDKSNSVHYCVSRLFSLLRLWDYENPYSDKMNQECQDFLTNMENCLITEQSGANSVNSFENADNIETYLQSCKSRPTLRLTDDMVFEIVTICLMSISRLKSRESNEVQGVVAVTLATLSQLLQFTITRLQKSFINMAIPDVAEASIKTNSYSKLRNVQENQALMQRENNKDHIKNGVSVPNKNNNILYLKESDQLLVIEKAKSLNNGTSKTPKRTREKPKSLLSKLRRRKGRDSSDSDASDTDQPILESSSDEMHSDMSEDDALSENDILSDDNTDDEESLLSLSRDKTDKDVTKKKIDICGKVCKMESIDTNCLINGERYMAKERTNLGSNDQNSVMNSAITIARSINSSNNTFEENSSGLNDTIIYTALSKKQNLKPDNVLNMLTDKEILASIKVCCDWLRSNPDIARICVKSSRILLKRLIILLNLIDIDDEAFVQKNEDSTILSNVEKLRECVERLPLPEDIDLKGLNLLEDAHKSLDWCMLRKHKMNKREETLLRVLKLIEFGHHLASSEDSGVRYDSTERVFVASDSSPSNAPKVMNLDENHLGLEHPRRRLMSRMGKLWLKAEVCALENRLCFPLMSLYLVPDHEALAKYMPILKRLVYAKKFIVIIPTVVVSALDEIKRISSQAREATRWLEIQLKLGSSLLRLQKPTECSDINTIAEPNSKDKEDKLFYQIMKCCKYFNEKEIDGVTSDGETPVVTLLTGCNLDDRKILTYNPDELAESEGVHLEHIESFQSKWKSSSKSHG